jgi:AcrR family transcriptional regulator
MTPRKYTMTRRAATAAATRERIIDATVTAHRDLGIQATSWEEIARRAGVGVGTVYRHFRSLDQLLPACGDVVTRTLALPTGDDVARVFDRAHSSRERIQQLVGEVFGAYERGAPYIDNVRRERETLPQLEPWHRHIEESLDALTHEALRPLDLIERTVNVVRALIDLSTWQAFKNRGLSPDEATKTVAVLIECSLRSTSRPNEEGTGQPERDARGLRAGP